MRIEMRYLNILTCMCVRYACEAAAFSFWEEAISEKRKKIKALITDNDCLIINFFSACAIIFRKL